jgi:hypothetical protein
MYNASARVLCVYILIACSPSKKNLCGIAQLDTELCYSMFHRENSKSSLV